MTSCRLLTMRIVSVSLLLIGSLGLLRLELMLMGDNEPSARTLALNVLNEWGMVLAGGLIIFVVVKIRCDLVGPAATRHIAACE